MYITYPTNNIPIQIVYRILELKKWFFFTTIWAFNVWLFDCVLIHCTYICMYAICMWYKRDRNLIVSKTISIFRLNDIHTRVNIFIYIFIPEWILNERKWILDVIEHITFNLLLTLKNGTAASTWIRYFSITGFVSFNLMLSTWIFKVEK